MQGWCRVLLTLSVSASLPRMTKVTGDRYDEILQCGEFEWLLVRPRYVINRSVLEISLFPISHLLCK